MSVYFDTSAMLKLVVEEEASSAVAELAGGLVRQGSAPATSWLGEAEFRRAGVRIGVGADSIEQVMAAFMVFEVPQDVYDSAARLPMRDLRTLDALHISLARRAEADGFVTYDRRQGAAAAAVGLNVLSP